MSIVFSSSVTLKNVYTLLKIFGSFGNKEVNKYKLKSPLQPMGDLDPCDQNPSIRSWTEIFLDIPGTSPPSE